MLKKILFATFATAPLLFAACDQANSNYCEGAGPNNDCRSIDARIDASKACTSNTECTGTANVCDINGTKTCVECVVSADCQMAGDPANAPVCGADHACHACTQHSECASDVCMPTGECLAAGTAAYVNGSTGSDTNDCGQNTPCKTLLKAIGTSRAVIKVVNVVSEAASVALGANVRHVFGGANAQVSATALFPILVASANTNVELHNVIVGNEIGISPPACILINAGTTASIKVSGGKIYGCQSGLSNASSGGTVTVTGATVTANGAAGITSSGGTVTVTGATVTANDGGGISVTGGVFKLVNNFIYRNGKSSSAVGGVNLNGTPAGSVFEFNTVVDNDASSGITHPGGVLCDLPAFAIGNNIIAKNRSNTDPNGATSQLSGQCTTPGSRIQADFTGLNFKSPVTSPFDYHLLAGSTAIDAASAVSPVVTDADGDARPQGAGKDQGADEFKP